MFFYLLLYNVILYQTVHRAAKFPGSDVDPAEPDRARVEYILLNT